MAYVWTEIQGEYTSFHFETEEEAIAEARDEAEEGFWVGEVKEIDFYEGYPFGENIIDMFGRYVYDEVGDMAEEYLEDVDLEHEKELDKSVIQVFKAWCKKYAHEPKFYDVVNEKFYPKL